MINISSLKAITREEYCKEYCQDTGAEFGRCQEKCNRGEIGDPIGEEKEIHDPDTYVEETPEPQPETREEYCKDYCENTAFVYGECIKKCLQGDKTTTETTVTDPDIDIVNRGAICKDLLDTNLVTIFQMSIRILQIAAAIILIVKGMMMLVPAVAAKDEKALQGIAGKLIIMAIVLLIILLLRPLILLLGGLLKFDTSCF